MFIDNVGETLNANDQDVFGAAPANNVCGHAHAVAKSGAGRCKVKCRCATSANEFADFDGCGRERIRMRDGTHHDQTNFAWRNFSPRNSNFCGLRSHEDNGLALSCPTPFGDSGAFPDPFVG